MNVIDQSFGEMLKQEFRAALARLARAMQAHERARNEQRTEAEINILTDAVIDACAAYCGVRSVLDRYYELEAEHTFAIRSGALAVAPDC